MAARLGALFATLVLLWAGPAAAGPFSDWAAIVVAGDFRGSEGGPTEAFDNARRDVAVALQRAGFAPGNIRQFSVRPTRYADTHPLPAEPRALIDGLTELTGRATGGCLIYFSSHGSPQGVVMGEQMVSPRALSMLLDRTCGTRPTVVVLSACFSGVFVPALAGPNRMVLTAARRDRTSFGCGQANRYPYFDDCFLQSMPGSPSFPSLAGTVQTCVAQREIKEGAAPPSEPQIFIGAELRPLLPLMRFASPPARDN
ncbi:MAG TPA: C13 family peptidase [Phenylobacterium sp.]